MKRILILAFFLIAGIGTALAQEQAPVKEVTNPNGVNERAVKAVANLNNTLLSVDSSLQLTTLQEQQLEKMYSQKYMQNKLKNASTSEQVQKNVARVKTVKLGDVLSPKQLEALEKAKEKGKE